jgi:hypothetical protein
MRLSKITRENIQSEWKYPATCVRKIWKLRTCPTDPCFNPFCDNGFIGPDWLPMNKKNGHMYCSSCLTKASVKVDSFLENSHLELPMSMLIAFDLLSNYVGISAQKVSREYMIAPDTALRFLHSIRKAMGECLPKKFKNTIVEVDEVFVKVGNLGMTRSYEKKRGKGTLKVPVIGISERNGAALLIPVIAVDIPTIKNIFLKYIDTSCTVYTDENDVYSFLSGAGYKHESVIHNNDEYVRDSVSTNNVEGLFSRLSSILDTYGNVKSSKLEYYCSEAAFKHTYGNYDDYGFSALLDNMPPLRNHYNEGKFKR